MSNPALPDILQDPTAFRTLYNTELVVQKQNKSGVYGAEDIPERAVAEWPNLLDGIALQVQAQLSGQLISAHIHGLATTNSDAQNTTAIQAAIDAAAAAGTGVLIPAGIWTFDGQLTNAAAVPIVCVGELVFSGSGEDAIVIGDSAAAVQYDSTFRSVIRLRRSTIDYADAFAGVVLSNVFEGRFAIAVENFETGLRLLGNNHGCVYNSIELGRMYDNLIAVELIASGSGWVNENVFIGGRIGNNSGTSTASNVIGFRLEDDSSVAGPNSNKFVGQSVELNNVGAGYTTIFYGAGNGAIRFNNAIGLRFEGTDYVLAGSQLTNNRIDLAFGIPDQSQSASILNGDTAADRLLLQQNKFTSPRAIGSDEPRTIARFGANNIVEVGTNVTRPARGVCFNENVTTFVDVAPGARDGDAVTLSNAAVAMGVVLDLRNMTRDFERVCWLKAHLAASGGRLVAACWDDAFNFLSGAEDCGPLTYAGGGGIDYYRTGVDMTADNSEIKVAFGDNVAFAFVGLARGSSDAQFRDFEIAALPHSDIEILKDTTLYDALSTSSGVGAVATDDAVAQSIPDAPAEVTDYPVGMVVRDLSGATLGWRWNGSAWQGLFSEAWHETFAPADMDGGNATQNAGSIEFPNGSATSYRCFLALPPHAPGGDLLVEIWLYGDGSASAAATFQAGVVRHAAGDDASSFTFTSATFSGTTIRATAGQLIRVTATLSGADLDGVTPGDPFLLQIIRQGVADAYTGSVWMAMGRVTPA